MPVKNIYSVPLKVHILSQSRSLYSTIRFFEEARRRNFKVKVYPPLQLSLLIDKNRTEIYHQKEQVAIPDCVIPRVGQYKAKYTLAVIRQYQMAGAKILNGSQSIDRSRDKLRTLQILTGKNIGMPKTFFLDNQTDIELALQSVESPPVIIKLTEGSQGMGVMLAETNRSARSILQSLLNEGKHILVQEFIEESNGEDVRAIILNGKLIACMKRISPQGEFRSNIHRGGHSQKINFNDDIEELSVKAAEALGLQFAGVDLLLSKQGPLVLEVNPSPGLEGVEKTTGVNVAGACLDFLAKQNNKAKEIDNIGV